MKIVSFIFLLIAIVSCTSQKKKKRYCYPKEDVSKIKILVADTSILDNPDFSDTSGTITNSRGGIGFVDSNGKAVHKPFQEVVLSKQQQVEFLKLFTPIPLKDEYMETSCVPIYRHVALFYDGANKKIGQVNICLECMQTSFFPEADCLEGFGIDRTDLLKTFFKKNNIYFKEGW
jgi:hypothetical protein